MFKFECFELASGLRDFAKQKNGSFRISIMQAANHIEKWPTEINNLQQCVDVPGVKAHLAKMIITEIMCRNLRDDEQAFLDGAERAL